jgi:drug/metabolite transporter (DMT)-like permease
MALVLLFFIKKKYAPDEKFRKEDIPLLAGAGITGVTLYYLFENNGILLIPASEASIITGSTPILIMIAEGVREKIVMRNMPTGSGKTTEPDCSPEAKKNVLYKTILPGIAAMFSLTGVALVAGGSLSFSGAVMGYVYMAAACVSWVCYCFLTRPLFDRRSRIYIVFWQSVIGFAGFLPFVIFENSLSTLMIPGLHVWGHMVFLGIFCSALAYWFYSQALRDLGIGTTSFFLNLVPVVSAIGGFFVLGERLRPLQLLGAGLVLAGVYLAMATQRKIELTGRE